MTASEPTPTARHASKPRPHTAGALAHEHLLEAAGELFYHQGVRAVGIEAVVERAGVNKMSLYRQFASKDDLVVAYLKRCDEHFFARFDASLAKHPGEPVKQLLQYFDDLARRASVPGYRGCPFVNVAAEFPDAWHPARQAVADNKTKLIARLTALAEEARAADPAGLADALALLIEGAYAASQTYGAGSGPIVSLPRMAKLLIDAACPAPETGSASR